MKAEWTYLEELLLKKQGMYVVIRFMLKIK